jgi:uncharacterized protein (TIGR02679 family)
VAAGASPGAAPAQGPGPAALAERPGLGPLWDELARRYGEGAEPSTVTLRNLSVPQRQALADLLGADRLPAAEVRIPLRRLAAALGTDLGGVRAILERLRGPIVDRRAARAADRLARDRLWAWLGQEAAGLALFGDPSAATRWVEAVRGEGIPGGDVDAHRRRLAAVLRVLAALPADGMALPSLAADALGDPHGLDRGRSAAAMALEAVAAALSRDRPADAEATRALWEEVGIVPDPLSSTTLVLGLRPGHAATDPLAGWLAAAAVAAEAVVLSLAQLRRWPIAPLPPGRIVYVVENPSLLTEAAAGGWSGPPIVCSSGRPTVATVTLLRQLGAGGATLLQHADFDAAGLEITAWLADRAGTTPWRMDEHHYRAALTTGRIRRPLAGILPSTPWAPALRHCMEAAAVAVYEEELRHSLLDAMVASA